MDQFELKNVIECLLFVSAKPITLQKFRSIFPDTGKGDIEKAIDELTKGYDVANKPIFIQNVAGGWRMATRKQYSHWVRALFSREITFRLSNAALEILSIIAYRQPVTIQEIETIRGVSSGGVVRGLLEKDLIKIAGRKEAIGRPVLYRTTDKFLEYFGLESISDIPPLEELDIESNIAPLEDLGTESDIAGHEDPGTESDTAGHEDPGTESDIPSHEELVIEKDVEEIVNEGYQEEDR